MSEITGGLIQMHTLGVRHFFVAIRLISCRFPKRR